MPLILLGASIVLLLVLIARLRINAFLALLLTSFLVGIAGGMGAGAALASVLKGIGDTLGSLVLILVFGAVLGKMIEESGAAYSISCALTRRLGESRIQTSVLVTGFLAGLPMVYNASFLVLIPLIYTLSYARKLPLLYLGIPLSAALSTAHGLLPPHPAPTAIASLLGADVNVTLLYGLMMAPLAALLAGPVLERFNRSVQASAPPGLFDPDKAVPAEPPGLGVSLVSLLAPVGLMLASALAGLTRLSETSAGRAIRFLGDPTVALFAGAVIAMAVLGLRRGRDMDSLMRSVSAAVSSVAMIALIIGAGGAFKQVLIDGGIAGTIQQAAHAMALPPLWLCWLTSALLRLALGSATVAAITAAGVVLPAVSGSGVAPELLVLALASGSLMFSHFNDIGFWMFKEYYNVSVKDTFRVWTVMESIVALVGLAGTLSLHALLPASAARSAKRVFYVNSYHEGYPPSDEAMAAIQEAFSRPGYQMRTFFLDAKRDPDEQSLRRRADEAALQIRAFQPGVVVVSYDDAVKNLVAPHLRRGPLPVVFWGVNWSSEPYGLPNELVTGMIEVVPVEEAVSLARRAKPRIRRLLVLSEDSTSERQNSQFLDARWRRLGLEPEYALVREFDDWKRVFAGAQQRADLLYLPTSGAIRGWDSAAAREWARRHLRIPAFTCDEFMMDFVSFGVVKIPREQGEWAARAALRILNGEKPSAIPQAENRKSRCYFHAALARQTEMDSPRADCLPWPRPNTAKITGS